MKITLKAEGKDITLDHSQLEAFNLLKDIKNNIEKKLKIEYNRNRHQYKNSECGVYSLNFILRLLNGDSFEKITKNKVLDDEINDCRDAGWLHGWSYCKWCTMGYISK